MPWSLQGHSIMINCIERTSVTFEEWQVAESASCRGSGDGLCPLRLQRVARLELVEQRGPEVLGHELRERRVARRVAQHVQLQVHRVQRDAST